MLSLKIIAYIEIAMIVGLFLCGKLFKNEINGQFGNVEKALVLFLPIALFSQTNIYVFFAFAALVIPMMTLFSREVVTKYLIMIILMPQLKWSFVIGGTYIADISSITFVSIGFLITLVFAGQKGKMTGFGMTDLAVAALILLNIIFQLREPGTALRPILTNIGALAIPYLGLRLSVRSAEDGQKLANALVISAVLISMIAAVETYLRWPLYDSLYQNYGIEKGGLSAFLKTRGSFLRIPATFVESTAFGVFLTIALIFSVNLPNAFRSGTMKGIAVTIIGAAMLLTFSRGAIIGSVVGLAAAMLYRGKLGRSFGFAALFTSAIGTIIYLATQYEGVARYVMPGQNEEASDYRERFWTLGIEIVKANPWSGVSLAAMSKAMASLNAEGFVDPVNTFLYFAIRAGFMGPIILLLAIVIPMILLWRRRGDTRRDDIILLRAAVFGSLVTFIIAFATTSFYERNPFWLLLCSAMAVPLCRRPKPVQVRAEPSQESSAFMAASA
jgi:O-Antigen ligase